MGKLTLKKACLSFLLLTLLLPDSVSQELPENVRLISGAVNGIVIKKDGKNLVIYGDPEGKLKEAEMVLLTHFRRDVIWAANGLESNGSLLIAPHAEKAYFSGVDSLWSKFAISRFHDYQNQTTKFAATPLKISRFVTGGDIIKWHDVEIRVLNTPGYTRGSVSYLVNTGGKMLAFTGDLICGDGKIPDLYSFQDSVKKVDGYHGYAVRLGQLISSLRLIASQKPDILIPARGPVITDPDAAIEKLIERIHSLYRNYLSVTANRWYHEDRMEILKKHLLGPTATISWMRPAETMKNPPSWYMHVNNSNLVIASDSSAFLIDCGTKGAFERFLKLKQTGRIKSIDGIFITHYHDDHTEYINDVVREFSCPVYVTRELKDILENPGAFHMPCLTTRPITGLTIVKDGQEMKWKNFNLKFMYFPGQTIYHDAVLFNEAGGESVFFIGDSFTPCGVDDYCLLNRNLLHPGTGYFYCLDILKKLPESTLLANQHLEPLFLFTRGQLDQMFNALLERNSIIKELIPFDDINYGVDEQWVSTYPYSQKALSTGIAEYRVKIFNHSGAKRIFHVEPSVPEGFSVKPEKASKTIASGSTGELIFKVEVPRETFPKPSLFTVSIKSGGLELRDWSEALIE